MTMATWHSAFSSEESFRYAAECRRLVQHSRSSQKLAGRRPQHQPRAPQAADWLSHIWNPSRKLAARGAR